MMSIFGNIMSSIFGHAQAQTPQAAPSSAQAAPSEAGKTSAPAPSASSAPAATPAPTSTSTSGSPKSAAAPAVVDVEAVLTQLASQNREKLDWRSSIVDLMKLLNLDSGISARKELANELSYSGDMNDPAKMNVWLHKQVMVKLAENGGKVPDSLKG
jgi:hypothetical protein